MKHAKKTDLAGIPDGERKLSAPRLSRFSGIDPFKNTLPPYSQAGSAHRNVLSGNSPRGLFKVYRLLKLLVNQGRRLKVKHIKSLVKSGRYETEEKIKITAARILETIYR
ncbi:MAG: hypothetical protein AAB019_10370 [Planctomycetota bacterium]